MAKKSSKPKDESFTTAPTKVDTPNASVPPAEPKDEAEQSLERWVGLAVVLLATFLGVCNIKDDNIVQKMQKVQADRVDSWTWYQARNIRAAIYEATGDELSLPFPGESAETRKARDALVEKYRQRGQEQAEKMKVQSQAAEKALKEYDDLNAKDDQFDLCEAGLSVALALMGVTLLMKSWPMFWIAMVPSAFGVFMGLAGFLGMDTNNAFIAWFIRMLS